MAELMMMSTTTTTTTLTHGSSSHTLLTPSLSLFSSSNPRSLLRHRHPRRLPACRASSSTPLNSIQEIIGLKKKAATMDVIVTLRILKEGLLDLTSHIVSDLLLHPTKVYLVSMDSIDPGTNQGKVSQGESLNFVVAELNSEDTDSVTTLKFTLPTDFGRPGAILVENTHANEFFLKAITIKMPDATTIHFPCHSWIVNSNMNGGKPRVFFSNQPYLPSATPAALKNLRAADLELLRGDGKGERKLGERIYDYDVYNDLGNPDISKDLARPNLGASSEFPYPRRCRTGRPKTKADPNAEEPGLLLTTPYLPRDENFSAEKLILFNAAILKSVGHDVVPAIQSLLTNNKPFKTFNEIYNLYDNDPKKSGFINLDGTPINFPLPGVVSANFQSWGLDQEFGRQRLAGANPLCIQRLTEFPIVSQLDEGEYGPKESAITRKHIEPYLGGLTVEQAISENTLYILDYHDAILPYVNKINDGIGKLYASRTIFHLTKMGFISPLVIELSVPPKKKGEKGTKRVFSVPSQSVVDFEWRLAKTHVSTLDSGIHELVSHWLRTHACVEPFIIATHRCLSTMHPLYTFLQPHFKDTMHINGLARQGLINAGGIIEKAFTPGQYSTEISSVMYRNWRFDDQALPKDLLKRGMAVEDPSSRHGLKLLIQDYPFAEDGLEVWAAIKQWATDYVGIYYKTDEAVHADEELQAWWGEIRHIGHGDHANADWWVDMSTREALIETLTTIVWITSGHHAAVNFGQYAYFGYMPNHPTMTRLLVPERDTPEYAQMLANPEAYFLKAVSSQGEATLIMATVELLAQHLADEEYLGERNDPQWSSDPNALDALNRFRKALLDVEKLVEDRINSATTLSHRSGPTMLNYTLLVPSSGEGLTFQGIPNSISI